MKTGWVIAVEDLHAKDKAFKVVNKSREEASKKVAKLTERYESIQKGRFKIAIMAPHTEIDIENRIKIRCKKTDECTARLIFAYLHELTPFCYKQTDEFAFMEVDINEHLNSALENLDYSIVE